MNLGLLIKLVKLANNNPNENEANLAARKVCKMIAESKYVFNEKEIKKPIQEAAERVRQEPVKSSVNWQAGSNPSQSQYDFIRDFMRNAGVYPNPFNQQQPENYPNWKPNERKEQRERTCCQCGKVELTRRVTNVFRCNACEWQEF